MYKSIVFATVAIQTDLKTKIELSTSEEFETLNDITEDRLVEKYANLFRETLRAYRSGVCNIMPIGATDRDGSSNPRVAAVGK